MSGADRLRWDEVYNGMETTDYPPPDPMLFDYTRPSPMRPNIGRWIWRAGWGRTAYG